MLALRILLDPKLGARVLERIPCGEGATPALAARLPASAAGGSVPAAVEAAAIGSAPSAVEAAAGGTVPSAVELLCLLQREGRLVDFLEQDVAHFGDADIGAAARAVHDGCRKALRGCCELHPVRAEAEDAQVIVEAGYDPVAIKLTGKLSGAPPYRGTLKHGGWRVGRLELPRALPGRDSSIVAPAEIEL